MSEISASLVKELRERTGAGMMDCKKALVETHGDLDAAIDWLRAKGLSKAAKKAGRIAAEGLVGVANETQGARARGAVIELNSETDFVARNAMFQAAVGHIAKAALVHDGNVEAILAAPGADASSNADMIANLVATIGENMTLRRAAVLAAEPGVVASYIHNLAAPDMCRIGVLVAVEGAGDKDILSDAARKVAMHVAATAPLAAFIEELDPEVVARERAVLTEQASASGKPAAAIEKMIEGRLRKFYEESVLVKQAFVLNPDQSVEAFIAEQGKASGAPAKLVGFVRFALGEGIEKKTEDFAAEVAAAAKGQA